MANFNFPIVNLLTDNDQLDGWLDKVQGVMNPIDWEVLQWRLDERDMRESYGLYKSKFFLSLVYYGLVGLFPEWFRRKMQEGRVSVFEQNPEAPCFGWATAFPSMGVYTVESMDLEGTEPPNLHGHTVLVQLPLRGKAAKTVAAIMKGGAKVTTLADLHGEAVRKAEITPGHVHALLRNMGGTRNDQGWWEVKPFKYFSLRVKYEEGEAVWLYREGDGQVRKSRLYYGMNGGAVASSHAAFLVALMYILAGGNYKTAQGRRAFLGNVFQDEVTVGWSHPILDQFLPRKLGTLQLSVNPYIWTVDVGKDPDFMTVLQEYASQGYSSFVHKGGKYAVIEAECTGFSYLPPNLEDLVKQAEGDETKLRQLILEAKAEGVDPNLWEMYVAWLADKLPKYTGRALWLVPSAAQMGKGLEYSDVKDFIDSF